VSGVWSILIIRKSTRNQSKRVTLAYKGRRWRPIDVPSSALAGAERGMTSVVFFVTNAVENIAD